MDIDYATGDNHASDSQSAGDASQADSAQGTYVLNISSKKFHLPSCGGISDIKSSNRQDYTGPRQTLIDQAISPAGGASHKIFAQNFCHRCTKPSHLWDGFSFG